MLQKDEIIIQAHIERSNYSSVSAASVIVKFLESKFSCKFVSLWHDSRDTDSLYFVAALSKELFDVLTKGAIEFECQNLLITFYESISFFLSGEQKI